MIYYIKNRNDSIINFFNNNIDVLNEDEAPIYTLNATGFLLRRIFLPHFSIQDTSGKEVLKAKSDNDFFYRKHYLFQGNRSKGFVTELSFNHYRIVLGRYNLYEIELNSSFKRKFNLAGPESITAEVTRELLNWSSKARFLKWKWHVELFDNREELLVLSSLALMYSYYSNIRIQG